MHQKLLKYLLTSTKTAITTTSVGQLLYRCCCAVLLVLMSSELRAQEIYACGSTPPSPHFVGTNQFTTPQGITITRHVDSGKRLTAANFTTGCGRRIGANYLQMGDNGTRRVVYTFSKPISSVMIWFFDLGNASQHWRKTKTYVSLNCAN